MSPIMIEMSIPTVIALAALIVSIFGISIAKKRNDNSDLKEATKILTELTVKVDNIENAVLGKPTLSEQVLVNIQKMTELERRISTIEQKN